MRSRQLGQSLVQILVSLAMLSITMTIVASLIYYQTSASRAISEKLASIDLERVVSSTLGSDNHCASMFVAGNVVAGSLTFDASTVSPATPYFIDFGKIVDANNQSIATLGGQASPLSLSLNVAAAQGIRLAVTSPTSASLLINFSQNDLSRPIRNLAFPMHIQTTGPIASSTVVGCTGIVTFGTCPANQVLVGISAAGVVCRSPNIQFFRFPTAGSYTGDAVCALNGAGPCVSQGFGANAYLFCGTAQSDPTGISAGVQCLSF
jgi:hypothetical protein